MYFNTYRSISNKNRKLQLVCRLHLFLEYPLLENLHTFFWILYLDFFFHFILATFFWWKLNPHNKWKCVRCWKWKKSCAIGPYENIHKVYYYATVRFIFYLFYSLMWQFFLKPIVKIYNNTSKQNLFFTWKKNMIWKLSSPSSDFTKTSKE